MRIIEEDSKLGITKVVWKFEEAPDLFKDAGEISAETATGDDSGSLESPEERPASTANCPDGPEPSMEATPIVDTSEEPAFPGVSETHLSDMRQQIQFLQQVIESQNQQLKTKDELIRNFQVLLKTEQEQVLKLEARTMETFQDRHEAGKASGWLYKLKGMLNKH